MIRKHDANTDADLVGLRFEGLVGAWNLKLFGCPWKLWKKVSLESSENLLRYIIKVIVFDKEKNYIHYERNPNSIRGDVGIKIWGSGGSLES